MDQRGYGFAMAASVLLGLKLRLKSAAGNLLKFNVICMYFLFSSHFVLVNLSNSAGQLNNSPLQSFLCTTLESAVRNALPPSHLSISNKYTYKLYIDGIILDHVSHPLTLLSMTIFLALLNTRLPTLITEDNTDENDEIGLPQFESDWQQSRLLCDDWLPPLVQLAVVAGRNVFVDPTGEEAAVSDGGILAIWHQSKVVGLRTVNTRDSSRQVFNVKSVATAVDVLTQTSREVENALRKVVAST